MVGRRILMFFVSKIFSFLQVCCNASRLPFSFARWFYGYVNSTFHTFTLFYSRLVLLCVNFLDSKEENCANTHNYFSEITTTHQLWQWFTLVFLPKVPILLFVVYISRVRYECWMTLLFPVTVIEEWRKKAASSFVRVRIKEINISATRTCL